uniref:Transcriptional regulator n=1 Tax=Steinernema glaseri TaxID=37863 RepID=A0A1I7Z5Y1_9BILA
MTLLLWSRHENSPEPGREYRQYFQPGKTKLLEIGAVIMHADRADKYDYSVENTRVQITEIVSENTFLGDSVRETISMTLNQLKIHPYWCLNLLKTMIRTCSKKPKKRHL